MRQSTLNACSLLAYVMPYPREATISLVSGIVMLYIAVAMYNMCVPQLNDPISIVVTLITNTKASVQYKFQSNLELNIRPLYKPHWHQQLPNYHHIQYPTHCCCRLQLGLQLRVHHSPA